MTSIDKPYYVILTGSKNNAGDFLIKYRAKALFKAIRGDRELVDVDAWKRLDGAALELVNGSNALILLGGPSLQPSMRPKIYPLVEDLKAINVPILTMGIGWKSPRGRWADTYRYSFNEESKELLDRINASGFSSSVRDYHSQNVLAVRGYTNFTMTGCPAYYDLDYIGSSVVVPDRLAHIGFSLGVSFVRSRSMERQMKDQILALRTQFSGSKLTVAFHHSLDKETFLATHGASQQHHARHQDFANWLAENSIEYIDISGSAEGLIDFYSGVSCHIGYRVHAHIFMNSISKPSILFAEDGRGTATKDVIGGIVIDGVLDVRNSTISKVFDRLIPAYDRYKANRNSTGESVRQLQYESSMGYGRMKASRRIIDSNYEIMTNFLESLP